MRIAPYIQSLEARIARSCAITSNGVALVRGRDMPRHNDAYNTGLDVRWQRATPAGFLAALAFARPERKQVPASRPSRLARPQ